MRLVYRKIGLIMMLLLIVCLNACGKKEDTEVEFMQIVTDITSYKLEGVMESFYLEGRKQSEFTVLYNGPDEIKVVLKNIDSEDSQIILKNKDGVYILIPTINKNFKIQSDWPNNANYPYLLQSLAQNIANEENPVITETETTKTIETETVLYKDAVANKQKIVLDKETCLPIEILLFDKSGELYIRVVFSKIDLDVTIDKKEFVIDDTMTTIRSLYENKISYENRSIKYPIYCPEGSVLKNENTETDTEGIEVTSIMTYDGTNTFTIIQQYVNDKETINYAQENGEIVFVLGNPCILKAMGIQTVYEGIEYVIASTDLPVEEMINILEGYMTYQVEK